VSSHPSGWLLEECEKNNISITHHDPTVDSRDMAIRALLVPPNSALLSLAEFSIVSYFFLTGSLFAILKAHFP
jgi:hypothetical protein